MMLTMLRNLGYMKLSLWDMQRNAQISFYSSIFLNVKNYHINAL
jgi:phosphatidylserine decarboxylase